MRIHTDFFSNEAEKQLQAKLTVIEELIIKEAVNEALSSRGEPIEVTASDVKSATERVINKDSIKFSNKLLTVYKIIGYILLLGAIFIYFIKYFDALIFYDEMSDLIPLTFLIYGVGFVSSPNIVKWMKKISKKRYRY